MIAAAVGLAREAEEEDDHHLHCDEHDLMTRPGVKQGSGEEYMYKRDALATFLSCDRYKDCPDFSECNNSIIKKSLSALYKIFRAARGSVLV